MRRIGKSIISIVIDRQINLFFIKLIWFFEEQKFFFQKKLFREKELFI